MANKVFRVILILPLLFWTWQIFQGELGAEPAKEFTHRAGEWGLYMVLANLLIGVLISFRFKFKGPLKILAQERRWLGILSFLYLTVHFGFYLILEGLELTGFEQILTKKYLIFGFGAWLILLTMTLTSNNFSVRKLGHKKWKNIHRFVHLAAILFTVHIFLNEKTNLPKYAAILAVYWILQAFRFSKAWLLKRSTAASRAQPLKTQ